MGKTTKDAEPKEEVKVEVKEEVKFEPVFTGKDIISSNKYADYKDFLSTKLNMEGAYTLDEIDRIIGEFKTIKA